MNVKLENLTLENWQMIIDGLYTVASEVDHMTTKPPKKYVAELEDTIHKVEDAMPDDYWDGNHFRTTHCQPVRHRWYFDYDNIEVCKFCGVERGEKR